MVGTCSTALHRWRNVGGLNGVLIVADAVPDAFRAILVENSFLCAD